MLNQNLGSKCSNEQQEEILTNFQNENALIEVVYTGKVISFSSTELLYFRWPRTPFTLCLFHYISDWDYVYTKMLHCALQCFHRVFLD